MRPNPASGAADRVRSGRLRWWLLAVPAAAMLTFFGGTPIEANPGLPPIGWSSAAPLPGAFGARWNYSVAYFPPTDQVVVFGGAPDAQGGSWKNDTWLYSVATDTWALGPSAPGGLNARSGAAMAYDPQIGKLVLFGGAGTDWPPYGDTWLFDGTSWSQGPSAPQAMGGRVGAGMVYDDALGKLVLFSGSGTAAYNDTWLFDGTSWTAGPASPTGMKPRVFFAMSYDQTARKVIVAGGDQDVDLWYLDEAGWTAGPSLPATFGPMERLGMAYDPQLGADLFFGGMGPIGAHGDGWLFRPADGSWILMAPGGFKPGNRFDASMTWVPTKDSMMLIGGNLGSNDGVPLFDTYFFRDVPPQQSSLTVTPSDPDMTKAVTMTGGGQIGGYGATASELQWYINGVLVPGQSGSTLQPMYVHGDQIQGKIRMHDSLNVYGPWVSSQVVTVIDRPPVVTTLGIIPGAPVPTDTLAASLVGFDPDGDALTYAYAWTVNASSVAGNQPTLPPSYFHPLDVVGLTVTPTDSFGMSGTPKVANTVTIGYNLTVDPAVPGGNPRTVGKGYTPNETVDIRIDSPTGTVLASWAADATGGWGWKNVRLPSSLAGGTHMMYGTGRTSGKVGLGPVNISAAGVILPTKFAAGASVTFNGVGFVPGETVNVSFPGQAPTGVVAASNGNATVTLVSPPEPNTGGSITGSAPSGTVQVAFSVTPVLKAPASGVPGGTASVSVTGYGVNETVNFSLDTGAPVASGVTDASGSLSATVPLTGYFGSHKVWAKGVGSGIALSKSLPFPATLTMSPTSGPQGTVVTIASGPGWKPSVNLTFIVGSRTLTPKMTDATGSVNFTYTISSQDPIGALVIKLYSSGLKQTAKGTFTVTG